MSSTDSPIVSPEDHLSGPTRYLAYASRLARLSRYLAFTSDVGEAFRPIVAPKWVTLSYGVSWAYCGVDVAYEGWKEHKKGKEAKEVGWIVLERSIFQALASMLLPAATIHTQVHVFQHVFKRIGKFQKWGPTVAGLALLPVLPYMYDKPVEQGLEWVFKNYVHTSDHHDVHKK